MPLRFRLLFVAAWPLALLHAESRPEVPATASPAPSRASVLEAWGWRVAHDADVAGAELSPVELDVFLRGAAAQITGQPPPCDLQIANGDLDRLAAARLALVVAARKSQHLAAARAFFANLAHRPNVVHQASGLCVEILTTGHGERPEPNQTATVAYTGRLVDGTEFTRLDPFDVILVPNRMPAGLFEGLQQLPAGSKARLFVPPALLVGYEEQLGLPAGAAAVFDVDLITTKPTRAEDLANSLLPPAPEPAPAPPSGFSSTQLLECWGWTTARKTPAATFGLTEDDRDAWLRGLRAGIRGEPLADSAVLLRAVSGFISGERARVRTATLQARDRAAARVFASLDANAAVVRLPSGLRYEVLQRGSGPFPRPRQVVVVDYVGRLLDGTVFDRTDNEPLHVEIGSVNEGLNEGLQHINAGGRIRLYVPPALGYGDEDASGVISQVPAHSMLIYELTLVRIEPPDSSPPESVANR